MALKLVTDENLLRELNGENKIPNKRSLRPVTDENLLRQLNAEEKPSKPSFMESIYKAMGIENQKNPIDFARDLAYGATKGAAQGAEMISQGMGAPTNNKTTQATRLLGNAMTGQPVPSTVEPFKYSDVQKYIEPIKSQKPDDWQTRLAQGIGSYLPYGIAGGASLPGQVAAGAAHGYATTEPGQKNLLSDYGMPAGKTGGAIESGVLNLLLGGAGKLANQLRPSVMFRGNLSGEKQNPFNINPFDKGNSFGVNRPNGDTLEMINKNGIAQVATSGVREPGRGIGKELYKNAIQEAKNRGLNFSSDATVSESAMNVYKSLEKEGYKFEYNPNIKKVKAADGQMDYESNDFKSPVVKLISAPNHEPESELARNLRITRGTETGIGDVIGSPFLKKRLENTLTSVPFSGANEALQRTGQEVVKRGENVLSDLVGGKNIENAPEQIYESLLKQFEKHKNIKNNLYDKFNEESDKQFLDLSLKNFSSKAKEYKEAIESTNILKYEPALKNILGKLGIYEKPLIKIPGDKNTVNEVGQNLLGESLNTFVLPSAKEVNLLKGKLGEYAKMYGASPDPEKRYLSKIFGDLSKSLKEDLTHAVENSGNEELKSSYKTAEENYRKNFSKFLDKDIYKYIGGSANEEEIVNKFIKTKSNADLAKSITNLARTLPEETKPLLGYSYLSRALDNEGNLNPAKLGTLIDKLKPNQFKALFPDQNVRTKLKDYNTLQHMNKEAQYLMFNPKTGQRTTDVLMTGLLGALGHIGAGNYGGALLAPGAAILGGRAATKALTSESLRESLIREMLRNRTKYTKRTRGAQAGAQGVKKELQKELQEE